MTFRWSYERLKFEVKSFAIARIAIRMPHTQLKLQFVRNLVFPLL